MASDDVIIATDTARGRKRIPTSKADREYGRFRGSVDSPGRPVVAVSDAKGDSLLSTREFQSLMGLILEELQAIRLGISLMIDTELS